MPSRYNPAASDADYFACRDRDLMTQRDPDEDDEEDDDFDMGGEGVSDDVPRRFF